MATESQVPEPALRLAGRGELLRNCDWSRVMLVLAAKNLPDAESA